MNHDRGENREFAHAEKLEEKFDNDCENFIVDLLLTHNRASNIFSFLGIATTQNLKLNRSQVLSFF